MAGRAPCQGCGGPKPPGRGLRYCETCECKPAWTFGQSPCRACGSTEGKRLKKQYCDECLELRRWRSATRRRARKLKVRKPCEKCGGRKDAGTGQRWCEACRAKRALPVPCRRCAQKPVRAPGKHLCESCHVESIARHRANNRARARKDYAANREKLRARKLAEYRRRKQDPVRRAGDLELRRLRYRLRRQRQGLVVRDAETILKSPQAWLPGQALAAAIMRLATSSDIAAVCELAGTNERHATRWRRGEQQVSIDDADRALTGLGLLWWDVWTEDSVRVPLFEVHTYNWQLKSVRGEKHRWFRVHQRTIPYGDAGPDHAKLAEISARMSGEAVAA